MYVSFRHIHGISSYVCTKNSNTCIFYSYKLNKLIEWFHVAKIHYTTFSATAYSNHLRELIKYRVEWMTVYDWVSTTVCFSPNRSNPRHDLLETLTTLRKKKTRRLKINPFSFSTTHFDSTRTSLPRLEKQR